MKKNALRVVTYTALGIALALSLLVSPSALVPDADAVFSHDCYCDLGQSTQTRWGLGNTCQESRDDLDAQAFADYQAEAPVVCSPPCSSAPGGNGVGCEPQLIITGQCTWNSQYQKYVTDGHYNYGCFTCP